MAVTLPFNLGRGLSKINTLLNLIDDTCELAYNYLRLTGVTTDAQTVTIGTDVLEVDTLVTAVTPTLTCTNSATQLTLTAHALTAGQVIKAAAEGANTDEIMHVVTVVDANTVIVKRARSGTAASAHSAATVTKSTITAGRIPLGVLSTSAANFCSAFIAEVNAGDRGNYLGQLKAVAFGTTSVALFAKKRGLNALATTETLANGAFDAATMGGGIVPSRRRIFAGSRVPTAAEVTAGIMIIPCAFSPTSAVVQVVTTATGALVLHAGAVEVVPASGAVPGYVKLTNGTDPDWSASTTVYFSIAC